jgi:hypothetical protein
MSTTVTVIVCLSLALVGLVVLVASWRRRRSGRDKGFDSGVDFSVETHGGDWGGDGGGNGGGD